MKLVSAAAGLAILGVLQIACVSEAETTREDGDDDDQQSAPSTTVSENQEKPASLNAYFSKVVGEKQGGGTAEPTPHPPADPSPHPPPKN